MEIIYPGTYKTVQTAVFQQPVALPEIREGLNELSSGFSVLFEEALEHNDAVALFQPDVEESNLINIKLPTDLLLAFTASEESLVWKSVLRGVLEHRGILGIILVTKFEAPMDDSSMSIAYDYKSSLPEEFFIRTYKTSDITKPNDIKIASYVAEKILQAKGYDVTL